MNDFQQEQIKKLDGFQANVQNPSNSFKKVRFKLDNLSTKEDYQGRNIFEFPFKSFWVVDTNNKSFVASMSVNPKGDGGDPIPLKPNMSIPFEYRVNGCAIICNAQPGVWIDIVFAFNSDILPGFSNYEANSKSTIDEGGNFTDGSVSIDNSGNSVVVAANSNRKKAIIQNVSGQTIWVGTPANLANANYKKRCQRIDSGNSFEWRNSAQLNGRVEVTTTDDIAVMELT